MAGKRTGMDVRLCVAAASLQILIVTVGVIVASMICGLPLAIGFNKSVIDVVCVFALHALIDAVAFSSTARIAPYIIILTSFGSAAFTLAKIILETWDVPVRITLYGTAGTSLMDALFLFFLWITQPLPPSTTISGRYVTAIEHAPEGSLVRPSRRAGDGSADPLLGRGGGGGSGGGGSGKGGKVVRKSRKFRVNGVAADGSVGGGAGAAGNGGNYGSGGSSSSTARPIVSKGSDVGADHTVAGDEYNVAHSPEDQFFSLKTNSPMWHEADARALSGRGVGGASSPPRSRLGSGGSINSGDEREVVVVESSGSLQGSLAGGLGRRGATGGSGGGSGSGSNGRARSPMSNSDDDVYGDATSQSDEISNENFYSGDEEGEDESQVGDANSTGVHGGSANRYSDGGTGNSNNSSRPAPTHRALVNVAAYGNDEDSWSDSAAGEDDDDDDEVPVLSTAREFQPQHSSRGSTTHSAAQSATQSGHEQQEQEEEVWDGRVDGRVASLRHRHRRGGRSQRQQSIDIWSSDGDDDGVSREGDRRHANVAAGVLEARSTTGARGRHSASRSSGGSGHSSSSDGSRRHSSKRSRERERERDGSRSSRTQYDTQPATTISSSTTAPPPTATVGAVATRESSQRSGGTEGGVEWSLSPGSVDRQPVLCAPVHAGSGDRSAPPPRAQQPTTQTSELSVDAFTTNPNNDGGEARRDKGKGDASASTAPAPTVQPAAAPKYTAADPFGVGKLDAAAREADDAKRARVEEGGGVVNATITDFSTPGISRSLVPNACMPQRIDNEFWEGFALFKLRTSPLNPQYAPFFELLPKAQFEIQIQGRFKVAPRGELYMAGEVPRTMKLGMFTKAATSVFLRLIQMMTTGLHYSLGNSDMGEIPHLSFPLTSAAESLVVTPIGEEPPALGVDQLPPNPHKGGTALPGFWNTQSIYTLSFYSSNLNFNDWTVVNVPGQSDWDLRRFWNTMPVTLAAYDLPPDHNGEYHMDLDKRYYMRLEIGNMNVEDE